MSETRGGANSATPGGEGWSADLELLAIEEHFMREYEAGREPRLAVYAQRYPAHAEALTAFVAEYLSPLGIVPQEGDLISEADAPRPLSVGAQRALDAIFGAQDEAETRLIAERRETYTAENDGDAEE